MTDTWGREIRHNTLIVAKNNLKYLVLENKVMTLGGVTYVFEGLHVYRGQEYFGSLEEFIHIYGEVEVFF